MRLAKSNAEQPRLVEWRIRLNRDQRPYVLVDRLVRMVTE